MRTAYFDCFAGASGDMILGALLDLGLDEAALRAELAKLDLPGWQMEVRRVSKLGLTATKVDVLLEGRLTDAEYVEVAPTEAGGDAGHYHDHHHHRHLHQILQLLESSPLHPADRTLAARIFRRLGEAESRVHGVPVEKVHFHEVGGVDAIIDIVGACVGLRLLGIGRVVVSPMNLGGGFVKMAHGLYPVPGPATANLLEGAPAYSSGIQGELLTPTGAAILTAIAAGYGPMPAMTVARTGYGAGTRDRAIPNVLRVIIGEEEAARYATGEAVVIETNIDDMNPELYEHLMARLLADGALDVTLTPAQMKKNRPGQRLQVLVEPSGVEAAARTIFAESTAIGVRTYPVSRYTLERAHQTVQTPYGPVRVKVATGPAGAIRNAAPEYEDCRAVAASAGVPLKEVYRAALALTGGIVRPDSEHPW